MRFADRTGWDLKENAVTRLVARLRRGGKVILDLTESNPTRCGLSYPKKKILAPLGGPEQLAYEPSARGMLKAREAVCAYYAGQKITLDPQQVFLTASTSEAYTFLFRLLVNPTESVLFPRPSYPLFEFLAGLNDVSAGFYPLVYDQGWRPDFEKYRAALTKTVKAVVLVNPNNPTGSYVNRSDFVVLNSLAKQQQIPFISDEVFHDYAFDPRGTFFSLLQDKEHLTFTLGGLSKTMGLPQMKISWIIVNGPARKVHQAVKRLEMIADTYLSVATPSQNALRSWLKLKPVIQGMILQRVRKNLGSLKSLVAPVADVQVLEAQGGWYAVLKLPAGLSEERLILKLLEEDHVLVHPGYFYDFFDAPYLVASLLVKPAVFNNGISRLLKHATAGSTT